jgi:hypothetical protein
VRKTTDAFQAQIADDTTAAPAIGWRHAAREMRTLW